MIIYNILSNGSVQVVVASIDAVVANDVMKAMEESNPSYNLIATEVYYEHPYFDFTTNSLKERTDKELLEARLKAQPAFTELKGDTLVPVNAKSKYHGWDYNLNIQVFNEDNARTDCYARLKARYEYVLEHGFTFVIAGKKVVQPVRMSDIDKLRIYMGRIGDSSNLWYFDNRVSILLTNDDATMLLSKMENAYAVVTQSYFFIKGYIKAGMENYLIKFQETDLDENVSYLNEGTK